ncbi:MAG: TolC family protein [Candidatus Omnitrophica bacterium]|nr:TolC family protein [Candidatus Omnitrophota bacterium]
MNRKKTKTITFLLTLAVSFCFEAVFSQEAIEGKLSLDLEKTIEMTIDASEDLQIQDNEIKRGRSKYKEERSDMFPQVNAFLSWGYNYEYPDITATALMKDYDLNSGVTLNQKIYSFGKIAYAVSAAKKAITTSTYNRQSLLQEVIYSARIAYFSAYLAKRSLEIVQESYNNAQLNKAILEKRAFSGRVSKHDNIKISADIAARMPIVNNARAVYLSAIETLSVAVGADRNQPIELTQGFSENYPSFVREEMLLSLRQKQPAIKALAKTIKEKEDLLRSKKAGYFPEVSAFASWNHLGSGDGLSRGRDAMEDYGIVGAIINVPIFTGKKTQAEVAQALIDKDNAVLEHQKGLKAYALELDKAMDEYNEYRNTLEANKTAVTLAEQAFDLSQNLFKAGQISVTDLNDAELQLTNQRLNKESTLFNLEVTLARIERLTLEGNNNGE